MDKPEGGIERPLRGSRPPGAPRRRQKMDKPEGGIESDLKTEEIWEGDGVRRWISPRAGLKG